VKEGDPIDGNLFQVTNYSYYLKDVTTSSLSDDDFSQVIFLELCLFHFCLPISDNQGKKLVLNVSSEAY